MLQIREHAFASLLSLYLIQKGIWEGIMENNLTWLLVADASRAKLYAFHKAKLFKEQTNVKNLKLIGEYSHDASRKKTSELTTDRMGEFGSGSFIEATSPKLREAEQFAVELLEYLAKGREQFRDIIIIAPPAFMGIINNHLSHVINKLVTQRIEKDYTQYNEQELLTTLLQHL